MKRSDRRRQSKISRDPMTAEAAFQELLKKAPAGADQLKAVIPLARMLVEQGLVPNMTLDEFDDFADFMLARIALDDFETE